MLGKSFSFDIKSIMNASVILFFQLYLFSLQLLHTDNIYVAKGVPLDATLITSVNTFGIAFFQNKLQYFFCLFSFTDVKRNIHVSFDFNTIFDHELKINKSLILQTIKKCRSCFNECKLDDYTRCMIN